MIPNPGYISAQGSTFFSFIYHVYIDIIKKIRKEKNVLACARILILKISKKIRGVTSPLR